MTRFYTIAEKAQGDTLRYPRDITPLVENLFEGKYLVTIQRLNPQSNIKDYRRCYFAKLDGLAAEVGESRYDMHEIIKEEVLLEMPADDETLWKRGENDVTSTGSLTEAGWIVFIEQFELWAFTTYSVILR